MKKVSFVIVSALIIVAEASLASGVSGGGGRGYEDGLFWGADLNRDERLDKNEAKAVYNLAEDEIFARYDEDKSGYITGLEFREYMQESPWVDRFVHPKDRK